MLACGFGEHCDNLRNLQNVFLRVYASSDENTKKFQQKIEKLSHTKNHG